jgi:Alginate export
MDEGSVRARARGSDASGRSSCARSAALQDVPAIAVLQAREDRQMDESKTGKATNQEQAVAPPRTADGPRPALASRVSAREPAGVGAQPRSSYAWAAGLACACLASALIAGSARAQDAGVPAPEPAAPAVESAPVAPPPPVDVAPAPPPPVVVAPPPPPPLAPPPPAAPAWSPVYTGSFFTRYELRQGFDNAGVQRSPRFLDGDAIFYRARFGIGTGPIDLGKDIKVGLQFTPQASGMFGALTNTTTDAALGLHEGYLRAGGKYFRLDTGRFELNYGDALIIGNLDWNETGRTFDGMRSRISKSPTSAWFDLFATLVREGRTLSATSAPPATAPLVKAGDGDHYFFGGYAALGPAIKAGLDLDVYLLAQVWGETEKRLIVPNTMPAATYRREGAGQVTFGARVKQKVKVIDYRLEAGLQGGSRVGGPPPMMGEVARSVDVLAYHADLEFGVALVPDKFRISLEGVYASGDDPTTTDKNEGWDELYPTAHKWLGLTDAFFLNGIKRTNVGSGVLHLTLSPVKDLTIQADGHLFARLEQLSAMATATGMAGGEVDIGVSYQIAKGLKARGLYGVFMPDSDFYPTATALASSMGKNPDPVHFLEVELRYDL